MPNSDARGHTPRPSRRLGVAIQGIGGAVATTMLAGLELMRHGLAGATGLPLARLAGVPELVSYDNLVLAGWDVRPDDALAAAGQHKVLSAEQIEPIRKALQACRPWPAVSSQHFLRGVTGTNVKAAGGHRQAIDEIRADLRRFREVGRLDSVVVLNLASTESPAAADDLLSTPAGLEAAIARDDPALSPSVLYACAAILEGAPYVNFTPSRAAEWPALIELAIQHGVPLCGRDGKTGQTLLKTVLAPAFRDRHLKVEGWFSTNLLGNRDGAVLAEPANLRTKLQTKGGVLEGILGYPVENHQVHIHYYPPRGDAKEAWDNIDLVGFLGQPMQVKVNFLCRDSILAAPLAIDLVRLADLAQQRGHSGPVEELAVFFKSPVMRPGNTPEHDFFRQQARFEAWLHPSDATA